MRFVLNELLGDSKYKTPIRIKLKINSSNKNIDYEKISTLLCDMSLDLEVLVDESDGSYQLCVPSREDWIQAISRLLYDNLPEDATIELPV